MICGLLFVRKILYITDIIFCVIFVEKKHVEIEIREQMKLILSGSEILEVKMYVIEKIIAL